MTVAIAVTVLLPLVNVTPGAAKIVPEKVPDWPLTVTDTGLLVAKPTTVIVPLRTTFDRAFTEVAVELAGRATLLPLAPLCLGCVGPANCSQRRRTLSCATAAPVQWLNRSCS